MISTPYTYDQLTRQTLFPILSMLFERFSYHALHWFLFDYVEQQTKCEYEYIRILFTTLIFAPWFLRPFGGLLADRLMGNRNVMALGNLLMIAGCIAISIPHEIAIITGLTLILLSTSIYTPANYSQLLKVYNGHEKSLDGSLVLLYTAILLGTLLGPVLMATIDVKDHFQLGFLMIEGASVIALVFSLLCSKKLPKPEASRLSSLSTGRRTVIIIGITLSSAVFWFVYDYENYELNRYLRIADFGSYYNDEIIGITTICIGIVVSLVWYFTSFSTKFKWIIGFTAAFLGICAIVFSQETESETMWLIIGGILFSFAEIFTIGLQAKLIQRYASDKYLATILAIVMSTALFIPDLLSYHTIQLFSLRWIIPLLLLGPLLAAVLFTLFVKDPSRINTTDEATFLSDSELLDE